MAWMSGCDFAALILAACPRRRGLWETHGGWNRQESIPGRSICAPLFGGVRQAIFLAFRVLPNHSEFGESSRDRIGV